MGLIRDISPGPVAVDTCLFIYYIEEHEEYLPLVAPVFEAIDRGSLPAVTTALTLFEVLVVPIRRGIASSPDSTNRFSRGAGGSC